MMMMMQDAAIKEEGAPAAIHAAPRNEGRPRMRRRAFPMPRGMEDGRWKTGGGSAAAGAHGRSGLDSPRIRQEIRNLAFEPADERLEALRGHDRLVLRAP